MTDWWLTNEQIAKIFALAAPPAPEATVRAAALRDVVGRAVDEACALYLLGASGEPVYPGSRLSKGPPWFVVDERSAEPEADHPGALVAEVETGDRDAVLREARIDAVLRHLSAEPRPEDASAGVREAVADFLDYIRNRVDYWAGLPDFDPAMGKELTVWDRCDGVAFSILLALDQGGFRLFDEDGAEITAASLHDHPLRREGR